MAAPSAFSVTAYYRAVTPLLLAHLAGHRVSAIRARGTSDGAQLAPCTADAVLAAVADGVIGFRSAPAGRIAVHLTPGDGADIATVATAALQLAEQCAADGLRAVPVTDGAAGLWLLARTGGDAAAAADRYIQQLTRTAPELGTTDPGQADGRSLITQHTDADRMDVPVPYTLLPAEPDPVAVIPLHLDEIAAITAGMPAELTAADVPDRIAARGDLAAGLLDAATA